MNALQATKLEKKHAQRELAKAVDRGDIIRQTVCEICDAQGRTHGHHDDYTKPLEVRWLCPRCHRSVHLVLNSGESGAANRPGGLSPRESQILLLVSEGLANKEIAIALQCGTRTIETHRERIYAKTNCHSAVELVRWAILNGMVPEWTKGFLAKAVEVVS